MSGVPTISASVDILIDKLQSPSINPMKKKQYTGIKKV